MCIKMCIRGKESDSFTGNNELTTEIVAITGLYVAVRKNNLMKSFQTHSAENGHTISGRNQSTVYLKEKIIGVVNTSANVTLLRTHRLHGIFSSTTRKCQYYS